MMLNAGEMKRLQTEATAAQRSVADVVRRRLFVETSSDERRGAAQEWAAAYLPTDGSGGDD